MKNYIKIASCLMLSFFAMQGSAGLSDVNKKPVFIIEGLVNAADLNGKPAIQIGGVAGKEEPRIPVLVCTDLESGKFKSVNIKQQNLRKLIAYPDQEKTLVEIIQDMNNNQPLGSFKDRPIESPVEKMQLEAIASALTGIVPPQAPKWQDRDYEKWRLIGAYLAENHGMWGMRFVMDWLKPYGGEYAEMLSATWDRLGNWQH